MEHKIGEIVTLSDGRKAEVAEGHCRYCTFNKGWTITCIIWRVKGFIGECFAEYRSDKKNIIYKEIKEN